MMTTIKGTNIDLKNTYEGFYMNRNGIEFDRTKPFDREKANAKMISEKYFKDGYIKKDDFGREVQFALITEKNSEYAAVNNAAEFLRENMDPLYLSYLKLEGISDKILRRKTSRGFLSRVYWTARMETNEQEWIDQVADELSKDDTIINNLLQPITRAKENVNKFQEQHEILIRDKISTSEQIAISSERLEDLKRPHTASENNLQNELRSNEELDRHIDDIHGVSALEAEQINTILKPIKKLEKDLEEQKIILNNAKSERSANKQLSLKAKTKETSSKRAKLKDMGEKDVEIEERKLKDIQDKYDTELEELQEKMHNKQIPEELYNRIPNSNRYALKDPSNRLKLRKTYESDFHRRVDAKAYYDSILNQTAEDNINSIMKKRMGEEKENPLVNRTLMLRDVFLYENNWLHPDPSINVMNYRNVLGRKIAEKTILNRLTINGTYEELIERFTKEHQSSKNELSKPLNVIDKKISAIKEKVELSEKDKETLSQLEKNRTKLKDKYDKQVKRLGRSYRKNKKDLELTIGLMKNKSNYSKEAREYSRMANLYAVATKLGFLAFTMSTDLMATVFKFGFWPSIRDGLFPMMKTLGSMANTKEALAIRENAAHAHLAQNHINHAVSDKNWTGTSQTYEPVQGKLTTGLETLAHYSNNFSLANYVENHNQRFVAQVIQSKVMKAMMDFQKGELSKSDLKDLLKYGLDPKVYANRFVEGWKNAGSDGNGFGGYQSRYWEWADKEASNQMSQAILRGTKDTIIRRGLLDAPFAMNNPLINSLLLFKGYTLASMTRYLGPLLQKPDARKIIGTMLMMTAGATQNPLRRLVAGQDPMEEEDHMFRNAIRDGGVFSSLGDPYEEMAYLLHGLFDDDHVSNERYRNRTEMGVLNGPIGGMVNDMSKIMGMVSSREFNKSDSRRAAANTPFLYSWELRGAVNKWIENSELPKTRQKAHKLKEAG